MSKAPARCDRCGFDLPEWPRSTHPWCRDCRDDQADRDSDRPEVDDAEREARVDEYDRVREFAGVD